MPVHDPDGRWLRRAIESVLEQVYPFWELCIADDASLKPHVRSIIEEYERRDSRIKVKYLESNLNISGASNEAATLAAGEFLAYLDHDDELAPFALYEVAKALNDDRDLDIFYSDEDKISPDGLRVAPYFKPEWSPDLLLSCNYMTHFRVYRRSLVEKVGGHRIGYEGSQDYDLALRLTESSNKIKRIPHVLYHWREASGSAAATPGAKPGALNAAKRALADALARRGIEGTVTDGLWPGSYSVRYGIRGEPLVSIIIPTKDKARLLARCIDSVRRKTRYKNYEMLVVDNGSVEEETKRYLSGLAHEPTVQVLDYPHPFNFSAINNFAATYARGEYLLFLNNDTEVISEEWLGAMLEHAQRPEVGAVGARLLYSDGRLQHGGVIVGLGGVAGHAHKFLPRQAGGYFARAKLIQNFSAVTAACLLMRASVFRGLNGFDEGLEVAFGDVDLCLRLRERGLLIVWTPHAELYHHESVSRGYEDTFEKQRRFRGEIERIKTRWGESLLKDPYYNPNLTLDREDFSLAV
jgi:GT2 family glycosyltransferase